MNNVPNRGCIRRLSWRALRASRTRNLVAIAAIALTTLLFTSLFTIALSLNDGFQQSNFRQCGGWSHGAFKYLTQEQFQQLRQDPLVKQWGLRRFIGMPRDVPFNKSHVEIGYSDANEAHWMFCDPVEGSLPQEGTNQAATDTHVLALLGVKPELGAEFTVTFDVDGQQTTQTFQLCGWWEYDSAIVANHILIPESRVNEILNQLNVDPANTVDGMTGSWNLDVMLKNSLHIEQDLVQILGNYGYQCESRSQGDNYIDIGVNWGYTGAQLSESIDPSLVLAIAAMLALIVFTGYLIIYNVFQISVAGDIRFYGLLKTIGTTPRQLKRIIRHQALALCLVGIPLGLGLGWLLGAKLTPVIIARLDGIQNIVSVRPVIFLGAAVFALLTVLLSCARPGRMAARVSPIEAVRYTEGRTGGSAKQRRSSHGVSIPRMAWANLGRSRSKTLVTVLSLALAVVLLSVSTTFTGGFDMDKYLRDSVCDFQLADASHFQTGNGFSADTALSEQAISALQSQPGIQNGGRVYGKSSWIQEFITEDYFRKSQGQWYEPEALDRYLANIQRNEEGLLCEDAQLYGMEAYPLSKLNLLQGDLAPLSQPDSHAIAAVYTDDDYGRPRMDSHWARLGDTIKLRYVEEYQYVDATTGEVLSESQLDSHGYRTVPTRWRDVTYTVTALVTVPNSMSYRYYGDDEFILGADAFRRDTQTDAVLYYACDAEDAQELAIEEFLQHYTQEENPLCNYESKATYVAEFESFRSMFSLLGGVLSAVVGLVGVLNFFNAILTGILARKREFAVLQSIGMTGRQLKSMLICEGLLYALGSVALATAVFLALSPLLAVGLENLFWFFTYRFNLMPIALLAPVFALLGCLVPLVVYHFTARATIVERLREAEN